MKRVVFLFLALSFSLSALAQGVNADYDRNALTVIAVHHNDQFDALTDAYLKTHFPGGEKFDNNNVATTFVQVPYARYVYNTDNSADKFLSAHINDITAKLKDADVPRQVIGKWFNRSEKGIMDLNVINKRAEYNATDQTYNIATAQALGEYLLHGEGIKLLNNSYILVVDHSQPQKEVTRSDNGQITQVKWSTQAIGYLYKLSFSDIQRQAVYKQWIYDSDDEAASKAKIDGWNQITFPMLLEATSVNYSTASFTPTSNNTDDTPAMKSSVQGCAGVLMNALESKVNAWLVKSAVYKVKPITSKIGTKEGLHNMTRFQVKEYMLDDNGQTYTRNKGYVRATEVAQNTRVARGESPLSRFYQISGGTVEPGMLLVQKPSINLDIKALYYGGAAKGYGVEFDYLFGMSNGGSCSHVRMAITYNNYAKGTQSGTYILNEAITSIAARLGYGYGIRPFRQLEIIPGAYVLGDYLDSKITENENEGKSFDKKMGWGVEAGIDANITVFYPVKINVGGFYTAPIFGGSYWKEYKEALKNVGQNRQGFTWRAGLVYEF